MLDEIIVWIFFLGWMWPVYLFAFVIYIILDLVVEVLWPISYVPENKPAKGKTTRKRPAKNVSVVDSYSEDYKLPDLPFS